MIPKVDDKMAEYLKDNNRWPSLWEDRQAIEDLLADRRAMMARIAELEKIVGDIHEAMGEQRCSDDKSLPDLVETFVREHRERIEQLERELAKRTPISREA